MATPILATNSMNRHRFQLQYRFLAAQLHPSRAPTDGTAKLITVTHRAGYTGQAGPLKSAPRYHLSKAVNRWVFEQRPRKRLRASGVACCS